MATHTPTDTFHATTGISEAELGQVLALVGGTDVEELEVRFGEARVSIRRDLSGVAVRQAEAGSLPSAALADEPAQPADDGLLAVTSPLVGFFHPTVKEGEHVEAGQVLGKIDVMG